MRSVMADFGITVNLTIKSDATAAIGMAKRQGLGKVRHLAVSDLWVKQRVRMKELNLEKYPGKENPADLLTKILTRDHNQYLMGKVGLFLEDGRPEIAPQRVKGSNSINSLTLEVLPQNFGDDLTVVRGCLSTAANPKNNEENVKKHSDIVN